MRNAIYRIVAAALPALFLSSCEPAGPAHWKHPDGWDKTCADVQALEKYRCPKPTEFASVFSFGFADDHMPADPAKFEALLVKLKAAGFNTIHTAYRPDRPAACGRHGMKLMIDFLYTGHLVYKTPEACQAVCKAVEGDPNVWGYDVWNQVIGSETVGKGRRRDVNNVRRWDPSHPAYVGTWGDKGLDYIPNADVLGYYDLAWGKPEVLEKHFVHLMAARNHAIKTDAIFYSWLGVPSGTAGEENYRRCLWSANTGIACGLKGAMWFLGTNMMDEKTHEWKPAGLDIARVNKAIVPVGQELMAMKGPVAVYSTPVTATPAGVPLAGPRMPTGLEGCAFPKDGPFQPVRGEFLVGLFKDAAGRDVAYIVNHSAVGKQEIAMKGWHHRTAEMFSPEDGTWHVFKYGGTVEITLAPGESRLVRYEK